MDRCIRLKHGLLTILDPCWGGVHSALALLLTTGKIFVHAITLKTSMIATHMHVL